jgi:hypothetical protein
MDRIDEIGIELWAVCVAAGAFGIMACLSGCSSESFAVDAVVDAGDMDQDGAADTDTDTDGTPDDAGTSEDSGVDSGVDTDTDTATETDSESESDTGPDPNPCETNGHDCDTASHCASLGWSVLPDECPGDIDGTVCCDFIPNDAEIGCDLEAYDAIIDCGEVPLTCDDLWLPEVGCCLDGVLYHCEDVDPGLAVVYDFDRYGVDCSETFPGTQCCPETDTASDMTCQWTVDDDA